MDNGPVIHSVRQITAMIRGAIAQRVPPTLHVLGEVGDVSRPGSGHLYFTLKDSASELRCVMWKSSAARVRFKIESGMELIATGGIEVYEPRGTYQLIVQRLEPRGVGALELAFRQMKERLEREGLFDASRKRAIPAVPFRIAVVTSTSGAAIRDVLRTLGRRFPVGEILILPVRVQGDGAATEIAAAVGLANRIGERVGGIDVMIVTRGGGSIEDLWAFNEEIVARAIAASEIPVVSGVGHEVDVTICDLVADLRAPTPTAAAELVTPALSDLLERIARCRTRAARIADHVSQLGRSRLERLLRIEWLARPDSIVGRRAQVIDERHLRLRHAVWSLLRRAGERLAKAEIASLRFGSHESHTRNCRRLDGLVHRYRWALARLAVRSERRAALLAGRMDRCVPGARVKLGHERLGHCEARLRLAMGNSLGRANARLKARVDALTAFDPKRVLQRGYSITRELKSKRIVRSIADLRDGVRILTELADGEFTSTTDDPKQRGLFD